MQFKKPSNCNCGPGGYRTHGNSWRVLQRREAPKSSQLKCLACGWKWWSSRHYVRLLADHKEVSRSGLTDDDVIERISDGSLTVLVNEARVFSFSRGEWKELQILERESNNSTYRFVRINHKSKQKKVALHRLVWMFANRRTVPDGYDVDHIEGKSIDCPDAISNLRLLESQTNRSRGKPFVSETEPIPF